MSRWTAPAVATPRMMARTLATFYIAAGAAGVLAVLGPESRAEGRWVVLGLAVFAFACGAIAFRVAARWPRHVFHYPVGSAASIVAVMVAISGDPATAMASASLMAFIAVDAFFFFSLPLAWVHMTFAMSAVTAALVVQGDIPLSIALSLDAVMLAVGTVVRGLVIRASSASRDPLTGLANRRGFDDALQELLGTAGRSGERLSAALIDLDFFKQINDLQGHEAGDRVLCRIAGVWRRDLPPGAVLARHGGDEFALLLPGVPGREALDLVRRISERHADIGLSVGVAEHHPDQTAADLMRRADRALYDAKAAGRGRAELEGGPSSQLAGELAEALDAGDVQVHYQSIVAMPDAEQVAVEALGRWTHPERGPISPAEFITVAEQSGLILALGEHVLRTACTALAGVRTRAGEQLGLAVNVSSRELSDPGYPQRVRAVLAESGFPADRLVLEVTESMLIGETRTVLVALDQLRAAGIRVSIDDFGTGYSSFARLDTLPIDVLKLDRSFISTISSSPRRVQMLQSLVTMCAGLGMDVVAEGVETPEQDAVVRAVRCTFVQGWLYGRAVPLAELLDGLNADGLRTVVGLAAQA